MLSNLVQEEDWQETGSVHVAVCQGWLRAEVVWEWRILKQLKSRETFEKLFQRTPWKGIHGVHQILAVGGQPWTRTEQMIEPGAAKQLDQIQET